MTRPLAIAGVQARMSSTRLPGKSLADLAGKPLIQRVVERARASGRLDEVFVLTSVEPSDDPLVEACASRGIPVRRGPLADVTARYEALVAELDPRFLVRITGDCPLLEPRFIDLQLAALEAFDGDFARVEHVGELTGTLGGMTAMSTRAFRLGAESTDPRDREHVASFFFARNVERFRYVATDVDPVYRVPGVRLAVDEAPDLELVRAIYERFGADGESAFPLPDVLRWLAANPHVSALNGSVMESADNRALRAMPLGEARIVGRWP